MLFRRAAFDAATQPLGEVLLVRPIRATVLVTGLSVLLLGLLLFVVFFEYAKTSEVKGILVPMGGMVKVVAPMQGTLDQVAVREGGMVAPGDTLAVIRAHRATMHTADVNEQVAQLLNAQRSTHADARLSARELAQEQLAAVAAKLDGLDKAVLQADRQIALQELRVELARKTFATFDELGRQKFVSNAQLDQHKADLLDQQLRLEELMRIKLDLQREQQFARTEKREQAIRVRTSEAVDARSIAQIDQELTELRARQEGSVKAMRAGKVATVVATAGQTVNAGQTILLLLPSGAALEAEVYATSRAIGFVSEGLRVRLRYQAFPFQRYGFASGTVREVARSAVRLDETSAPMLGAYGLNIAEPVYRIRIALDSQTIRTRDAEMVLRPGSLVDASIVLERRSIVEWMVEPLLTLKGSN